MTKIGISLLFLAFSSLPLAALAGSAPGGEGISGGGDLCEDRFKVVAKDIKSWIKAEGPAGLNLAQPARTISVAGYSEKMLAEIAELHLTCVSPGDAGFPVDVDGQAKECRSERDASGAARITCDRAKFYSGLANPENDPDQYRI